MLQPEVPQDDTLQRQVSDGSKRSRTSTGSTATGSARSLVELAVTPPPKHASQQAVQNWCSQRIIFVIAVLGSLVFGVVCLALKETIFGVLFLLIPVIFCACAWMVVHRSNGDQTNTSCEAEAQAEHCHRPEAPVIPLSGEAAVQVPSATVSL
mmetsp:Transcript_130510/g.254341  ORF Transcript_130510/g.254341 Transcript_130510/m.254341 type:complete len:153 (+) Transcript_130510:86-544(+)